MFEKVKAKYPEFNMDEIIKDVLDEVMPVVKECVSDMLVGECPPDQADFLAVHVSERIELKLSKK